MSKVESNRGRVFWIERNCRREISKENRFIFVCYKPGANGRNIVGQQLPTLFDVICCVHLHTLLHVVACCCAKLETRETFSYMQTDATTPNNVGSCWPTMLRLFAPGYTVSKFTEWLPTSRSEWIMVCKNLKHTSFLMNWFVKWPIKFTAKILRIISTMHSSVASVLCPNHNDCSLDLCYLFSMPLNQLIFTAILRLQSTMIIFQKNYQNPKSWSKIFPS